MAAPRPQSPYRLLVEGRDDECAIIHLLARHGYDWDDESVVRPYVRGCDGFTQLLDSLPASLKTYQRLGIVLDADDNLGARWAQVQARLAAGSVALPHRVDPDGAVQNVGQSPLARIGVWLMPDNTTPGYLEHFLSKLVPAGCPVWKHAEDATRAALAVGAPLAARDRMKGTLHAWLAWQVDPGLPFGTALKAKVLAGDSSEALRFVRWFRALFA